MPYFTTYSPKYRVVIKDLVSGEDKVDVSDDLVSISTNKAYGRAAGTWQMLLTFRTVRANDGTVGRYDEIIALNDVITIEMDAGGGLGMQAVMIGLVDRVSKTRQGGALPNRQIKISGRDMGKALATCDIGWDINTAKMQEADKNASTMWGSYERRQWLQQGTPGKLFEQIAQIFYGIMPVMRTYVECVSATPDNWLMLNPSFSLITGMSVWDALKQCSHDCWNMLHTDTQEYNGRIYLEVLLEQIPIDSEGLVNRDKDRTHIIQDEEIIQDDVGVSDEERINLLSYWPEMQQIAVDRMLHINLANRDMTKFEKDADGNATNIPLHGYRPKIINDSFFLIADNSDNKIPFAPAYTDQNFLIKEYNKRANYFWGWYYDNHEQANGTIMCHLRPDIKTGDRLLIPENDGVKGSFTEFMVEQVAHQISVWPTPVAQTTLHVTRGHKITDEENYAYDAPPAVKASLPPETGKAATPAKEVTPVVPAPAAPAPTIETKPPTVTVEPPVPAPVEPEPDYEEPPIGTGTLKAMIGSQTSNRAIKGSANYAAHVEEYKLRTNCLKMQGDAKDAWQDPAATNKVSWTPTIIDPAYIEGYSFTYTHPDTEAQVAKTYWKAKPLRYLKYKKSPAPEYLTICTLNGKDYKGFKY